MFPPELSILRNTDPRERSRPDLPFLFSPVADQNPSFPFPPTLEEQEWARQGPEEHRGVPSGILSVQCEESRMVVSIDKESLQVTTQSKMKIVQYAKINLSSAESESISSSLQFPA